MNVNSIHFLLITLLTTGLKAMEPQQTCASQQLDPLGDGISSLELLRFSGEDLDITNAARVSYGRHSEKFSDADQRLLTTLISSGHETPFEQTFLQYRVKLPIFVARQWMRHRVGVSYNEQSARYTKMAEEFYIPKDWRNKSQQYSNLDEQGRAAVDTEARAAYLTVLKTASRTYEQLLNLGTPRELARGILPVSLYTQFVFACNVRSLFHFVELRADSHAQWEIQQYAKGLMKLAQPHFPVSIDIWCKTHKVDWFDERPLIEKTLTQKSTEAKVLVAPETTILSFFSPASANPIQPSQQRQ
jgi:thymidylate synthase (FAD)